MSAKDSAAFRAIEKQIGLLGADVEATKLMVRRVDVANATEALIMSQVRELQRYMRNLQALIDARVPSDAYGTLKEAVDALETIIPQVDARLLDSEASLRSYVDESIPVVSNDVALRVYQEERSKEIECVPKKEYLAKVGGLKKLIEELDQRMDIADKNAVSRSFIQGKQTLQANIKRRLTVRQRDFFDRWIKNSPKLQADKEKIDKLKGFKTFWPHFKSYCEKLTYKSHFDKWKSRVERLQTWDLYHHRLKKNILYWRDRACPDIKEGPEEVESDDCNKSYSRIPGQEKEEEEEEEEQNVGEELAEEENSDSTKSKS